MYFGPLPLDPTVYMPILNAQGRVKVPLRMLEPLRDKIMLNYGRSLERLALHRGLTAWEALELIRPSGTMPPKDMAEQALIGEVSIWEQCPDYVEKVVAPAPDYSDCIPMLLKGDIAHLKYGKVLRDQKDPQVEDMLPLVLYITSDMRAFSLEDGKRVDRSHHLYPTPPASRVINYDASAFTPRRQGVLSPIEENKSLQLARLRLMSLEARVDTLFDAIKHGDEDHQGWLKEAIDCHFAGKPMPTYVAGKPKAAAQQTPMVLQPITGPVCFNCQRQEPHCICFKAIRHTVDEVPRLTIKPLVAKS